MKFIETKLRGVFTIELEPIEDERGFFARSFCQREFKKHVGLFHVAQCNMSYNKKAGTIRGMHYQIAPYEEAKLVQCTAGAIYDVIIDLRVDSLTFQQWFSQMLTVENHKMVFVPKGFAHGYLSLKDGSAVFYLVDEFYQPKYERTIQWDNPNYNITWPKMNEYIVSKKDQQLSQVEVVNK